ncbi:MAG: helix-turn-helix domain-containing protein [Candidatus Omnitrophica bacterium]|nr:helix-turn-helix domain-containing protein [Candidatus Omnitrophota bacterium]
MNTRIIDASRLADYLNINPSVIYDWVRKNTIPHQKVNSTPFFNLDDIEQWIERSRHRVFKYDLFPR